MGETDASIIHGFYAKAIRSTVILNGGHVDQRLRVNGVARIGMNISCYSTHNESSYPYIEVLNKGFKYQ